MPSVSGPISHCLLWRHLTQTPPHAEPCAQNRPRPLCRVSGNPPTELAERDKGSVCLPRRCDRPPARTHRSRSAALPPSSAATRPALVHVRAGGVPKAARCPAGPLSYCGRPGPKDSPAPRARRSDSYPRLPSRRRCGLCRQRRPPAPPRLAGAPPVRDSQRHLPDRPARGVKGLRVDRPPLGTPLWGRLRPSHLVSRQPSHSPHTRRAAARPTTRRPNKLAPHRILAIISPPSRVVTRPCTHGPVRFARPLRSIFHCPHPKHLRPPAPQPAHAAHRVYRHPARRPTSSGSWQSFRRASALLHPRVSTHHAFHCSRPPAAHPTSRVSPYMSHPLLGISTSRVSCRTPFRCASSPHRRGHAPRPGAIAPPPPPPRPTSRQEGV